MSGWVWDHALAYGGVWGMIGWVWDHALAYGGVLGMNGWVWDHALAFAEGRATNYIGLYTAQLLEKLDGTRNKFPSSLVPRPLLAHMPMVYDVQLLYLMVGAYVNPFSETTPGSHYCWCASPRPQAIPSITS